MCLVIDPARKYGCKRCKQGIGRDQGKVCGIPGPAVEVRDHGRADGGVAAVGKSASSKSDHDQGKHAGLDGQNHHDRRKSEKNHDHEHGDPVAEAVIDSPCADPADRIQDGDHTDCRRDGIAGKSRPDLCRNPARLRNKHESGSCQERDPDIEEPERVYFSKKCSPCIVLAYVGNRDIRRTCQNNVNPFLDIPIEDVVRGAIRMQGLKVSKSKN